jgi:hypothetical protein
MRPLIGRHPPVVFGFIVDQLDADRQLLANVEAPGALLIIPIEAIL